MTGGEPVTVDRCWPTVDGEWKALCCAKSGLAVTVSVPCEVAPGSTLYARRFGTQWSLVEPLQLNGREP